MTALEELLKDNYGISEEQFDNHISIIIRRLEMLLNSVNDSSFYPEFKKDIINVITWLDLDSIECVPVEDFNISYERLIKYNFVPDDLDEMKIGLLIGNIERKVVSILEGKKNDVNL